MIWSGHGVPLFVRARSFEKLAVGLGKLANETAIGKRLQFGFFRTASYGWVRPLIGRRLYVHGAENIVVEPSPRGAVIAANHRTFFDAYLYTLAVYACGATWPTRIYFPVRSTFFYENPLGLMINFGISGGAMYPPIFRDKARAERNRQALDLLAEVLAERGTLVGLHPEGRRNKNADPYKLLPAQPGIGQILLRATPAVIPCFVGGLEEEFWSAVRGSLRRDAKSAAPLIVVFGKPVDYEEFTREKPRAALYKKTSDRVLAAIAACGEEERELRAAMARGEVDDRDPGWLIPG